MANMLYNSNMAQRPVISPQFCSSNPVDLLIDKNDGICSGTSYMVTSAGGNPIFEVEKQPSCWDWDDSLVVYDATGNPIVTLRSKGCSFRDSWKAFRGQSKDRRDLIFTVKSSSILQLRDNLDVFLANTPVKENCDFKVRPNYFGTSCDIYGPSSSAPIAQMKKKVTAASIFLGKDKLRMAISPNTDCAMVVSLIIILEESLSSGGGGGGGG